MILAHALVCAGKQSLTWRPRFPSSIFFAEDQEADDDPEKKRIDGVAIAVHVESARVLKDHVQFLVQVQTAHEGVGEFVAATAPVVRGCAAQALPRAALSSRGLSRGASNASTIFINS